MGPAAKTDDRWHQIRPNTIKCTLQKNVASIIHDSFVSFCSLGRARAADRRQKTLFFAIVARPKYLGELDDKTNMKGCKHKTRVGMAGTSRP